VDKNKELQQARKQYSEFSHTHEQQLQRARMKYEEHLLNVVQSSNNETQLEACRRKMLTQKQEAENEIAVLKKKILQMEMRAPRGPGRAARNRPIASLDFFE